MPLLLDLVYLLIALLGSPLFLYKMARNSRIRAGWGQRLGFVPKLPARPRAWIHCASVGEVLVARKFIQHIKDDYPQTDIVISTNTSTGRETALKCFPGSVIIFAPFDFSFIVNRVFSRIAPSIVVLVELELWPNFSAVAERRGIPIVIVNGRITERSARRYRLFGAFARNMFRRVRRYAVQNQEYAERLQSLGVPAANIVVVGTMKYDTVITDVPDETLQKYRQAFRLAPDDLVLIGGCTHAGEEAPLINYVKSAANGRLRLILAPRHRERTASVGAACLAAGLTPVAKTAIDAGLAPADFERRPHAIIIDTTGELNLIYGLASVVFVGGSLIPHGGQNMIEPAALGKTVVFGPYTENFRDTVAMLVEHDSAVQVNSAAELTRTLAELLANEQRRSELGKRARELVISCKGATARNAEAMRALLNATLGRR